MDADTLVLGDICELFSANIDGYCIGACTDVFFATAIKERILKTRLADILKPHRARRNKMNLLNLIANYGFVPDEGFFNSGVLLMDCDRIRSEFPDYKDLSNLEKLHPHIDNFFDQDRLNQFFAGRWSRLPHKWNTNTVIHRDIWRKRYRSVSASLRSAMQEAALNPAIWHYMGAKKPWLDQYKIEMKFKGRAAYRDYEAVRKYVEQMIK